MCVCVCCSASVSVVCDTRNNDLKGVVVQPQWCVLNINHLVLFVFSFHHFSLVSVFISLPPLLYM